MIMLQQQMGQLRKRAVEEGLEEASIDSVLDSGGEAHALLVGLLVAHIAYRPAEKRGKLSKEGSGKSM